MLLSYFNLEYLSHFIFLLIPLLRGFYFREDMLSDVHTEDVAHRRTKPWCGVVLYGPQCLSVIPWLFFISPLPLREMVADWL